MTRKELYAFIKENALQGKIKNELGRNFTNVPTDKLERFLVSNGLFKAPKIKMKKVVEVTDLQEYLLNLQIRFVNLLTTLTLKKILSKEDVDFIINSLTK